MIVRVGEVMKVFASEGKVQVMYADTDSASLPLPMLTFNKEYSLPKIGDMVITLHFQNGSSRGVCLGTYYGTENVPEVANGYFKELLKNASIANDEGDMTITATKSITIDAKDITLKCNYKTITVEDLIRRIENLENIISNM